LFGTSEATSVSVTTTVEKEVEKEVEVEVELNDANTIKVSTVKKKKKKSKAAEEDSRLGPESSVPSTPDVGGVRDSCMESLEFFARSRYCYTNFSLINLSSTSSTNDNNNSKNKNKNKNENENDSSTQSDTSPLFSERISKLTLLRRLCQVHTRCNAVNS
jgi:hypothetical protein